ncbi:hypothetical protein TWF718_003394 [Orbilia javanica]|uniref:F-box domain-containing protein n=1 Tax=Orbilia javanica TaxID=47235 RepID=A0AAN8R7V5_9PEZI
MLLQKDGNGLFAALPTEICHFVLEYMDKESRDAFAKCSRHCYSIAFPARFSGIKLSESNYKHWLGVFTRGWLAPLRRSVHMVVLDTTKVKYIAVILLKLLAFPNLRALSFNIHAPKSFEGNIFNFLLCTLSTLPFYDNITHMEFKSYGYQMQPQNPEVLFLGERDEPAQLKRELKRETEMRYHYERDIKLFPKAGNILGPHISTVQVVEKSLNSDIYFPKNLRSLGVGMGSQTPYYFVPILGCPTLTTVIFEFFPSRLKDSKGLSNSLQFPLVKNLVIQHVGYYAEMDLIGKHFPNVEAVSVTKRCTRHWGDFVRDLPQVKKFTVPWHIDRWRYVTTDYLQSGIAGLLNTGYIQHHPTITFCGQYEVEGGSHLKYISATCVIVTNLDGSYDFQWEGDINHKPDDIILPGFQEEMLKEAESRGDDYMYSSSEEMDTGSVHSEYVDTEGNTRYQRSDEEEEDASLYGSDSEYWGSEGEVVSESGEDSEMDLDGTS